MPPQKTKIPQYWRDKRVVVTGSAGFVGSHLVRRLAGSTKQLIAVVSPKTSKDRIAHLLGVSSSKVRISVADLCDFSACNEVISQADIVLHAAGVDGGSLFKETRAADIFDQNIVMTSHILRAASHKRISRVLLISSIDVYGKNSGILRESMPAWSIDAPGYAWSKRVIEIAAKQYARQHELPIALARLGNIYGPGDTTDPDRMRIIPTFLKRTAKGEPVDVYGNGQAQRSFLYIEDAVSALLDLTRLHAQCDPVNIASGKYISIRELGQMIATILRRPYNENVRTEVSSAKTLRVSTAKAKRIIGKFEKISLLEGLKRTALYYEKL